MTSQNDEIIRTVATLPPGELSAFLAVAGHGGFRAAARAMGISASALSHAVAGLEARLKVQLFHRTTRNVSLTEAGQHLATRLAPALGEIGQAVAELGDFSARPTGMLRINAEAGAAEQVLGPLVLDFLRTHPEMRIEIVGEPRLVDLADGGFDCGIRAAELVPSDMVAVPIGPMQRHIVIGALDYLETAPPLQSPADLARHHCIQLRMSSGVIYRWEFERHGETVTVATTGRLVLDSTRLIMAAARDGLGLGYVTQWMAASDLERGTLRQVLPEWTPPYPGLCLYYPRHRQLRRGMRAFVEFARARFGK